MEYTFYKLSIADKCYVGSTIVFNDRMRTHKRNCKNENHKEYNLKVYKYIRDNGGFEKVNVMIIDKIIYNDKDAAREMETKFMLSFEAELNSQYPKRTSKEWYETNKQYKLEKQKQYREENKQKIAEKRKQFYEENKQKIAEKHKQYREENKQKIAEKNKQYYKETRAEKRAEKIACDICGKMMRKEYIKRHKLSQH